MLPAQTVGGLAVSYPNNAPGLARQGAEVYRASGCAYCHTQQVRPTELGSDLAHGWGPRRSVAHDYIFDQPVMLGTQRLGPDLANAGKRMDATAVLVRLWDPTIINHLDSAHSIMPSYKYLFEVRKIGRTPSSDALGVAAPAGYEIVPKPAARALAAYVANLRQEPYLFEAPPPPGAVSTNAPAGGTNAPAAGSGVPALPGGTNAANPQSAVPNPQSSK
jgi:cytochrome c oxidase cbb3-type subunit 2